MNEKMLTAIVLAVVFILAVSGAAFSQSRKYSRYIKQSSQGLLDMCLTGDDAGCFFYGGLMEKKGKRVDSRSAYLFGAMNARGRAGFVCMYSLGKSYEEGMNGDGDIVQAYRWYDVLANSAAPKDLKAKASARRRALGGKMSASEISFATMLAGLPL